MVGEDEVVVSDPAHISDGFVSGEARVDGIGDAGEGVVVNYGVIDRCRDASGGVG